MERRHVTRTWPKVNTALLEDFILQTVQKAQDSLFDEEKCKQFFQARLEEKLLSKNESLSGGKGVKSTTYSLALGLNNNNKNNNNYETTTTNNNVALKNLQLLKFSSVLFGKWKISSYEYILYELKLTSRTYSFQHKLKNRIIPSISFDTNVNVGCNTNSEIEEKDIKMDSQQNKENKEINWKPDKVVFRPSTDKWTLLPSFKPSSEDFKNLSGELSTIYEKQNKDKLEHQNKNIQTIDNKTSREEIASDKINEHIENDSQDKKFQTFPKKTNN